MSSNYLTVQEKVKLLEDNLKKADVLLDKRFLFFAFNCLVSPFFIYINSTGKKYRSPAPEW